MRRRSIEFSSTFLPGPLSFAVFFRFCDEKRDHSQPPQSKQARTGERSVKPAVARKPNSPLSAAILRPCSNRAASARLPAADAHSQTRASALASCEVSSARLILSAEEVMARVRGERAGAAQWESRRNRKKKKKKKRRFRN